MRIYLTLVVTILFCDAATAAAPPASASSSGPLAHYRFDGNGLDAAGNNPPFELQNTEFRDGALYLDGSYEFNRNRDGDRAVGSTPGLDYQRFSIVLRFKLDQPSEGASQPNLITGGTSHRWFGLRFTDAGGGKLIVAFDNGDYRQRIEGSTFHPGEWAVVVCTVDVAARRAEVFRDGKSIGTVTLPKDFVYDVVKNDPDGDDKAWSFTDYSSADTFHGWIDDFAIYDRVLSADEVRLLSR